MATSGRRVQEAIRARGSNKCPKHYGKEVIYVCETCDVLACVDCAIQQHKGHALEGISNVVPEAKQKLQDFIDRAEGTEIPRIKEKFQKLNNDLSKYKNQFQQQVSQIKNQNEILKKELDKIADRMVKSYHDMEQQNSDKLLNHQKTLQTQLDILSSKIQEVKASLQYGNDVLVYDTSNEILSEFQDLPTPTYSTAEFIYNWSKLQLQQLEHLLGQMNITDHYRPCLPLSQSANWRVMSEFTPYKGRQVQSIHAARDEVWLSDGSETMFSVNQKGQVQQTLHMGFCISQKTGNISFCSYGENNVREVKDGKDEVKFETDQWSCCICVTRYNHVLVGGVRQIVKYKQTGQKICTTSGGSTPVVRYAWRMSECPLTRHIAVVDQDISNCGGSGKPFISILNEKLQLLHTYRGEVSGQQPPCRSFYPNDVCYTDTGELVITDYNSENKYVVLVSGRGEYLQTLYTPGESPPQAVSVHSGALWLSLFNGKVQVLKYN